MSQDNLKIVTFNTWGVPYTADLDERTTALAQALATCDYDIVCLQEVWQKDNFATISSGAHSGGLTYQHHFRSGKLGSGLAILSRHPILEVDFHKFRMGGRIDTFWHGDYFAGKGIGFARIQTPVGTFDVYNIHPIAQYSPDERDEYKAHRATQHYEVTQFIRHHTHENPILALGDFNMLDHQIGYRLISQTLNLTDCWRECYPDEAGYSFRRDNLYNRKKTIPVDERLDYVFIRNGKQQKLTIQHVEFGLQNINDTMPYSDHDGVVVELNVAPSKSRSKLKTDLSATKSILEELVDVLSVGLMEAEYRQKTYQGHAQFGANAVLPMSLVGRFFGKTYSRWMIVAMCIYTLIAWFISEVNIEDEITQMTTIINEVQHQINAPGVD